MAYSIVEANPTYLARTVKYIEAEYNIMAMHHPFLYLRQIAFLGNVYQIEGTNNDAIKF